MQKYVNESEGWTAKRENKNVWNYAKKQKKSSHGSPD
jgi:hypothetical protein